MLHVSAHHQTRATTSKVGRNYCELNFTPEIIAKKYADVLDSKLLAKQDLHSVESSLLGKN